MFVSPFKCLKKCFILDDIELFENVLEAKDKWIKESVRTFFCILALL